MDGNFIQNILNDSNELMYNEEPVLNINVDFDPENKSKDNQTLETRPNSWKWQYVGNSKTSCNIKIWGAITDDTGTWTFESGNSATKTHQVTIIGT